MSEIIEERDGFRVRLEIVEGPQNPREEWDHVANVVTVPSRDYINVDNDAGPLAGEWEHLLARYEWSTAAAMFERWARIFHGAVTLLDTPNEGANCVWYLTGEVIAREQITDPIACLKAERDEYRAWAEGDVWGYVIEKEVTWVPKDAHDDDVEMTTWEEVEDGSCWGFYGRDYAESSAREAFETFMSAQSKS